MTTINVDVGEKLRALRKSADASQDDLAELAGLRAHRVSEIERGTGRPRIDETKRLCEALAKLLPDWTEEDLMVELVVRPTAPLLRVVPRMRLVERPETGAPRTARRTGMSQ